ncbi:MAG: hypothetical protein JWN70_1989, partial [Planctomycetaceae bacterium]|nr:hypothetical protein [Planctomycetaceae bacterium]
MVPNFSWRNWISSLTSGRMVSKRRVRHVRRPQLHVEHLEERIVLTYSVIGGQFIGDAAADHLILQAGLGGFVRHNLPVVSDAWTSEAGVAVPNPAYQEQRVLGQVFESEYDCDGEEPGIQPLPGAAISVHDLGGGDIIEMIGAGVADVTGLFNDTLIIDGSGQDDLITVEPAVITLDIGATTYAGIATIQINGNGGSDLLTMSAPLAKVVFNGGAGNDRLVVDTNSPLGADFDGGTGNDELDILPTVVSALTYYTAGKSLSINFADFNFANIETISDLGVSAVLQVDANDARNFITYQSLAILHLQSEISIDNNESYYFIAKGVMNLSAGNGDDVINLELLDGAPALAAIRIDAGYGEDQVIVHDAVSEDVTIDTNLNTITGVAVIPALINYFRLEDLSIVGGNATGLNVSGSANYEVDFADQNDAGTVQTDSLPIHFAGFDPGTKITLDGDNTTVVGPDTDDDFTVAGNPGQIETVGRPTVIPVNATAIGIEGRGGDDSFTITTTDAAFLAILSITGGTGNDTLVWDTTVAVTAAISYALENIQLNSNINTTGVPVTFTGHTVLTAPLTISTAGGDVVFDGPVDGAQTLAITAGAGDVEFRGDVGSNTTITSLTVTNTGELVLGGGVRTSGGNVDLSGATGGTRLAGDSTVVTNGGTLQVGSPVNATSVAGQSLTIDTGAGNITMMGVGTTTPLDTFRVADGGTFTANGNIVTAGSHTIDFGGVTLVIAAAGFTLDATGGGVDPEGADVILSDVNADAAANNRDLTILTGTTGRALLTGVIGATRLDGLTITGGGGTQISGNISAGNGGDAVTFNSNITLLAEVSINTDGTADGQVIFNGTVDGAQDLSINAATSSIAFNEAIGATQRLGDGDGPALNIGSADGNVTFNGTVNLASGLWSLSALAGVTFNENVDILAGTVPTLINGDQLTLNGLVFSSAGDVVFGDAATDVVTLGVGAVTISTAPGSGVLIFNAEVQGAQDLTIATGTGQATFNAEVGNAGATEVGDGTGAAITILSGTTLFVAQVDTNSGIVAADGTVVTFQSDVNIEAGNTASALSGNVILDGMTLTSDGAITLGDSASDQITISGAAVSIVTTGAGDNLVVNGKLDGAQDLTLNVAGSSTFNAPVGSQTPIGDGAGAALTITSTGTTTFASTLGASSAISQAGTAGTLTFQDNVTLAVAATATTFNANVIFDGLIFATNNLVTFGDAATDTLLVSGLTLLTASDDQIIINSATTLDANFTLSTVAGAIDYNGTVNGNHALVFNSTSTSTINGVIGGITPIASLTTNAGGTTQINANITAQGNTMTFNDPVVLISSTTLTDVGNVTFNDTLDGAFDLTLVVGGTTRFVGAVGAGTPLGDGAGAAMIFNSTGPSILESTLATNSGITQAGNAGVITLRGDVTLGNGNTDTTFNGSVVLDGLTITSADAITFGDDETDSITLSGGLVTITTAATGASQIYNGKINGSQDLTVDAGTGSITFNASIGETQRVGDGSGPALTITGADADVTFNGIVRLASSITSVDPDTGLTFNEDVDLLAGDTLATFLHGDQIVLNGMTFSSQGEVQFGNAVTDIITLGVGPVTITTAPGNRNLFFAGQVQGGQDLTVASGTGTTQFTAPVGTIGDAFGAALTLLSGLFDFLLQVNLASGIVAADGTDVRFHSDVNIAAGTTDSTLSGDVTLDGMTLTSAGAITLGNSTSDQISLSGGNVTITTTGAGDNLVVNGKVDGAQDLILNVVGSSVFNAPVGSQTPIGDGAGAALAIISTGTTIFASTLATASGIGQSGGAGTLTFQDNVNVAAGDTITNLSANVIFDGLIFTANGQVAIGDALADFLLISAATVLTTSDDLVVINSATTLAGNFTVDSGADGTVYNGTVNGNQALVLNSTFVTQLNGVIGGVTPINSITTNAGGRTELNASITAQGNTMTFNDPVLLFSSITLTDVGGVTFNSTLDGAFDLTLAVGGTTRFVGAVGATAPLGDGTGAAMIFNSTGPSIFESTLATASGITQAENAGPITLRGNATFGNGDTNTTFNGDVVLDGLTVTAADPIFFGSDETDAITLSGGPVTVTTSVTGAAQTFNGKVNGSQDLTVNAGAGSITFNASLGETQRIGDGTGAALTITDADADVTFNGTVSLASGLSSPNQVTGLTFNENVDILAGDTPTSIFGDQVNLSGLTFSSAGQMVIGDAATDVVNLTGGAVTISTAAGNANMQFGAEIHGGQDLIIAAGTGFVSFQAEVGDAGANEIGDLIGAAITILSGSIFFDARVDTNSGIVAADGTTVNFFGDVNIESGFSGSEASVFSGDVVFDGVILSSDGAVTLGNSTSDQIRLTTASTTIITTGVGDNVVVNGKLDGSQDLVLNIAGSSVFNAPVGSQTPIGDGTGAALIINSPGTTTFASTLSTASGVIQAGVAGTLTLQDNVNLGDGDTNTTFNANVIFDGLIFTANDQVTVGDATTDTLLVSGLTLFQTTNDLITINSATTLDANFTVSSGTANITYNGTVNGNHALVLNSAGTTRINGVIGGTTPINAITTDAPGTTELNASITAQGNTMTFNDPVLLISSITLTDVGNVTFNSTVDGAFDLTLDVDGTTRFVGAVGAGTPLGDGTGAAIIINSTGPTIFESSVTTASGITQAGNAGPVTFRGDVTLGNGDTNTNLNGDVVLDGVTITSADPIAFGDDETDFITLSGGPVTVITLDVTQTYNGKVNGSQDLIVNAGTSSITFNASLGETQRIGDGAGAALTIVGADADVTFNGTVSLASGLSSLDAATGLIFNENVDILAGDTPTTIFGDQVTLNGLVFSSAGDITFGDAATDVVTLAVGAVTISTAPGSAALVFNSEVQGAQDLTIATGTGQATFNAEVGNAGATEVGDGTGAAITILSGTTLFVAQVDTNSGIVAADGTVVTFQSDVNIEAGNTASVLAGDVILDGMTLTSDGAITLGNSTSDQITLSTSAVTINTTGAGDNLVVNGKLDGSQDLTLNVTGSSVFNAPVGSQTPIGDGVGLAVTITSTGTTTFASTLGTNSGMTQAGTAGTVTFQDNVNLGDGDTNTTFNANVIFDGLIFTANDPVTIGDATTDTLLVSGVTLLQTTNDLITINSATTLGANFTVDSGSANIVYNGTINGNQALVLNSTGTTRINGVIGGVTPINSITTNAGGTTELNANITAQGNTMTFNDPVLLISSITLTDVGGVTFNSTLDGAFDLTLAVGGTTRFVGAVGSGTPLGDGTGAAMIFNSTGPSIFESTLTTNSGITQAENAGPITLRGDATFGNGDTSTTFNGSVVLDGLTVTAADPISFGSDETDSITLSGGPVTVTTAVTGAAQTFNGKVNGSQDLTVDAGAGSITFNASLGETQRIGDGVGPALNIIDADADVTFNGAVNLASGLSSLNQVTGLTFNENVNILAGDTPTVINGDQVTLNGLTFSSAGNVTFGDAATDVVTLAVGAVTISTAPGSAALVFNAEVQGAQDLTIATGTGSATFNAEVGNAGATEVGDGIGAAITILSGTTLFVAQVDTNSGIVAADGTNVTFQSDVNIEAGDTASALSGNVTLDGMTLNSDGAITLGNSTSDQITLSTSAVTIVTTGIGDNLVVNGKLDGSQDLTLSVAGSSVFNAPVGSQTPIGDGTGLAVTITSTGTTTFASTLGTNSGMTQAGTAGTVTFQDNVNLGDGDTNTTFNANVIFDGLIFTANDPVTVGDATTDTLLVSGLTLFQTTNDLITINSATTLDADFTVSSGTANIVYNGTVNGNHALVLNSAGTTRINGVIGGITPINSITTDAPGTTELNANITAQGNTMTFNDPVLLISSITLTDVGGVTFNSTLDGAHDLTLAVGGTTRFVGAVGSGTPLGDGTGAAMIFNSTGPSIFESTLTTNSGITQAENAGPITLRGDATFGNGDTNTTFNGNVVLDGLTVTSADPIFFGSDETDSITLSGGPVTVTTAATGATQTFNGKVNGSQDLTVNAGAGSITFNASLGETQRIGDGTGPALNIVDADADVTFNGTVNLASGLSSLNQVTGLTFNENVDILAGDTPTVINGDQVTLNGLTFSSAGNVTFGDAATDVVTLAVGAVTISTAPGSAALVFNAEVQGAQDLTIATGTGSATFNASLGET